MKVNVGTNNSLKLAASHHTTILVGCIHDAHDREFAATWTDQSARIC